MDMKIIEREKWVQGVFEQIKSFIDKYGDKNVSTIKSLCTTNLKNSYVRGQVFPFLNIPIRYQDKELLGFYEYFGEQLSLNDEYMYCDFVIEHSYYTVDKDEENINKMVTIVKQVLKQKGYEVIFFDSGMATIKIERQVLASDDEFNRLLEKLLNDAIAIQKEIALQL